jgi:tripartite ATP-independent transporter DctP family solute receptor
MKRIFLKSIAAAALAAACSLSLAQVKELKFSGQNPKGHPIALGMEKFAELVAAKSGGKLKVNLFPGGTLGGDQPVITGVQSGTIEMHVGNVGIMASQAKELGIFDFPFMFANEREADAIVDGPFGKAMLAKLEPKGMHGLAYWELGFRVITNSKRALTKVDDIAGLKLRVIPNAINVDWVKALGANPTPMSFPEVYGGLESKAIDGQENPYTTIDSNKLDEVQKFLAITNHQYNPQAVVISKKFWDAASADEKKWLSEAAQEAALYQRKVNRELMGTALASLKKKGMQVSEFSPAELAKFREKMQPVVAKHGEVVGADTVSALQAELAKLRK